MAHPGSQDTTFEPQKSTLSSSRVSSSVVGDQKKLRKMTSKPNLNSPKLKASLKSLKWKTKLESPPPLPPKPHQSQPNLNPQASNEEEQRVSDQAPSLPDWRPMSPLFPTFPTSPTSPRRGTT
ncbi:hypothetical protein K439DRAFT_1640970 [Ramaria rubella]|nr:hypothetical protein K439DRAFT_1640970 [Ramaria rubella]